MIVKAWPSQLAAPPDEMTDWDAIRAMSKRGWWRLEGEPKQPPVGEIAVYDLLRDLVLIDGHWYSKAAVRVAGLAGIRPELTSDQLTSDQLNTAMDTLEASNRAVS